MRAQGIISAAISGRYIGQTQSWVVLSVVLRRSEGFVKAAFSSFTMLLTVLNAALARRRGTAREQSGGNRITGSACPMEGTLGLATTVHR